MVAAAVSQWPRMVSKLLLWLAVLTLLVEVRPAAAGWLPESFRKGIALSSTPSSHPSYLTIQTPSEIAADSLPMSAGSLLSALDQCGGTGGLCTSTSIGFVCSDSPWPDTYCPNNFECSKSNSSYWQCTLMAGRTPTLEQMASMQAHADQVKDNSTAPPANVTTIVPSSHGNISMEDGAYNTANSGRSSKQHSKVQEPGSIVPVCGPGHFAGRRVAMCNSTMDGFFVNSSLLATSGAVGTSKLLDSFLTIAVAAAATLAMHALDCC